MKAGYSLIELSIGLLFAAVLSLLLMQSFALITKSVRFADELMNIDDRLQSIYHQFYRDVSGVFMPYQPEEEKKEPVAQETAKKIPTKKAASSTQQKIKKLTKLFYGVNKNDRCDMFTFITSNPLQVYEKAANVFVRPRMVRVVYRLVPDKDYKDAFMLQRQESDDLDLKAFEATGEKQIRAYTVINNLKSCSIKYVYPVTDEKKEQTTAKTATGTNEKKPKVVSIEKRSDWPFESKKEAQEKKAPAYPQSLEMVLDVWDTLHETTFTYTFFYTIESFSLFEPKKQEKKADIPTKVGKAEASEGIQKIAKQIQDVFSGKKGKGKK